MRQIAVEVKTGNQQMFQNKNEICMQMIELENTTSQQFLFICFLFFFYLVLSFPEVNFAVAPVDELAVNFDSRLETVTEDITAQVLGSEKKVVITVIDLLNHETQERDAMTDLLEEKLTDLLYKKLPNQVVPYFETVYLRLEWRSTFPEIQHDPLTEDIAKLTDADWLLTGTHETIDGLFSVRLELYDLVSGDLLWQIVIGKDRTIETDLEAKKLEEKTVQRIKQNSAVLPPQNVSPVPTPLFPQVFQDPVLEQEKTGESDAKFVSALSTDIVEGVRKIPEGMVIINEGEFLMGSDLGDEDELPDHLVFVQSFYLDQHEVTNADYNKCLKCERGHGGFDTVDPQQPVVYVDWKNADAYCQFQNKRLPTEAEWEYAARAGSEDAYSFGNNISLLENYAWLKSNTVDAGLWGAKTVGSKKPNRWGLYDLYGNVMEWVQNYYMPDYFASARQPENHKGLSAPAVEKYPLRVVRGGAWGGLHDAGTPAGVRAAKRYAFVEWTRSFQIGFRCAMDFPETK